MAGSGELGAVGGAAPEMAFLGAHPMVVKQLDKARRICALIAGASARAAILIPLRQRVRRVTVPLRACNSCQILAGVAVLTTSAAWGDIIPTGDIYPANPPTWTTQTNVYVGSTATGSILVNNGDALFSSNAVLGNMASASGAVTIDGTSSTWTCSGSITIGNSGTGVLNIFNGAIVNASGPTYIASNPGSSGSLNFGDQGGTLTTSAFWGSQAQVSGVGTIQTQGVINDGPLEFGGTFPTYPTLAWTSGNTNLTVNLTTNSFGYYSLLGAGYVGTGTLAIMDGAAVNSLSGYLGYAVGSSGTATVDGAGSIWSCTSYTLSVGESGTGVLAITNGGSVNDAAAFNYLGHDSGSSGTLTVDGVGSAFACGFMWVGYGGTGLMKVTNSATANFKDGYLANVGGSSATVAVDGVGSSLTIRDYLEVARGGQGVVNITHGGTVRVYNVNTNGYGSVTLGAGTGGSGAVTVDGTSSQLMCSSLTIGSSGAGVLNITNGGLVSSTSTTVAQGPGSTGWINFGNYGGILTTGSFWGSPSQVTGTGTINTGGLVTDGIIVFDHTHGRNQALNWSGSQENVTINLTGTGSMNLLGCGYLGVGSLTIRDGAVVSSSSGYLGFGTGSSGAATVDGTGSSWTSGNFYVGYNGLGALNITNGGSVSTSFTETSVGKYKGSFGTVTVDGTSSAWSVVGGNNPLTVGVSGTGVLNVTHGGNVSNSGLAFLAYNSGSSGTVTVDGSNSIWASGGLLTVGSSGSGTLKIVNGGSVSSNGVSINSSSLVRLNVGDGSELSAGTGGLTNNGTIRLMAAPNATAGAYAPITAARWSGSGTVQALGGIWSTASHQFTIAAAANGTTGQAVAFNTLSTQRVIITDPSGDRVQADFPGTTVSDPMTFQASEITLAQSALLQAAAPAGAPVLDGWTFSATGYTAGNPVFLSLKIGSGYSTSNLEVWHFDGTSWTPYATTDLSYDGTYANFTVTGFSGYAVTTVAPEPASLGALGLSAMLLLRRRKPSLTP